MEQGNSRLHVIDKFSMSVAVAKSVTQAVPDMADIVLSSSMVALNVHVSERQVCPSQYGWRWPWLQATV